MAFQVECARFTQDTGNVNTQTRNFTAAVPAGQTIVLAINAPVSGSITSWTVTDSKGNTWTVRTTENAASLNYQLAIATCTVTNPITASDTYTVTVAGANPAKWCIVGAAFDNIDSFDVAAHTNGSAATVSVDAAATASVAETVVAAVAYTDAGATVGFTSDAGFTALPKANASPTSAPRSLVLFYGDVASGAELAAGGTLSSGQGFGVGMVALKQPAPAPSTPHRFVKTATGYMATKTFIR